MDALDFLSNAEPSALEAHYRRYQADPSAVDPSWRLFFKGFDLATAHFGEGDGSSDPRTQKEFQVLALVDGYRKRGHLFTRTNPVRTRRSYSPDLSISEFGLSDADLDTVFQAGTQVGLGPATLRDIVAHLEATYCESIGIEFMHIRDVDRLAWIREHIEPTNRPGLTREDRLQILRKLNQATLFEEFLQKKFVGQKRFSLEGGESLIPALDTLIESGTQSGVREVVIGMAHRGRLSTLAHILNKPYEAIFCEFEGKPYGEEGVFSGDVKYHLGYSRTQTADSGEEVTITLAPNPSHLEAVGPVVQGIARARIDSTYGSEEAVLPILIHGDAAIAGQGVVYELVQMAQLDGYRTGGTVHIVVNNQVGFTTNYLDARSSTYCTDVGKVTQALVFHVNADDADAVVQVMRIALAYRQTWHRDVFIDLLGYRRHGHNEGDEPKFTQPTLYKAIAAHPSPRALYLAKLIEDGVVDATYGESLHAEQWGRMEAGYDAACEIGTSQVHDFLHHLWQDYRPAPPGEMATSPATAVDSARLRNLAEKLHALPEGRKYFKKVERLFADRRAMVEADALDWALGELLAYASLLEEGHPVRLSGQDVERGTFSHRHAVVKTEDSEEEIVPLNGCAEGQARFQAYNSLLSEYAVSGFDYGYAFARPEGLTVWEAQFGDFNNGAQILFDQFLSAAEDKWKTMNGLALFLPHGYEGMGSEHSSGRMERFLQLASGDNFTVCNVTEPANFFHLLRRQVKWSFRKPLVAFTPKKLLRHPKAVSKLADFAAGGFRPVLDDPRGLDAGGVETVVFCSGKVFYDALERCEQEGIRDCALVRLEQIHPLPEAALEAVLAQYSAAERFVWLQEEPRNMGAWSFMKLNWTRVNLEPLTRPTSASPAVGSSTLHDRQFQALMEGLTAFSRLKA